MADYNKIFSDDLVAGAAIRDDQGRVISTTYLTAADIDSTLGTRVSALETTTTSLSSRLTTTQSSLATTQSSLATIQNSLSALATRVTAAETKISSLETTTTSLSTRVGTLETTITSLSSRTGTLETTTTSLSSRVGTLETTTTSLSSRITTTESSLATTQSSLATLTSTVSSHIADTYTKEQVDILISAIPKFEIKVVDELPTSNISYTTVYLVPDTSSTSGQMYSEWIYVKGTPSPSGDHWERLGVQRIDLTDYYTKTEIDGKVTTINSSISSVATRVTTLETTTTSLSTRVGTLETTTTSLSSRVTTLETSKQDALSSSQISAINTVVDLGLHSRTFTNWESES